ncbi:flagellar biosynthetic protein FliO [Caloramator sp. mosi_1]|uniref:flagellar biosynthetic protein FliO n=1 Tax=Caloramator sp. mosi_1 TaxID=3023090 RepID=UPI003FCDDEA5
MLKNYQYKSKYIKVIERVQIAPNNYILLIKIIDKTYVMVTSNNYSKVLFDIEDFKEITENNVDFNLLRYIKDNLKLKRED